MIGVIVTFNPDNQLDRSVVAKIARRHAACSKACRACARRCSRSIQTNAQARNFYVWDSEAAARELLLRSVGRARHRPLRRERPIVEFVDVLALVDNANASV